MRYEILRQEGGAYFDTDTVFNFNDVAKLEPQFSYFGFKFNGVDVEIENNNYRNGGVRVLADNGNPFRIEFDEVDIEDENYNRCDIRFEGINNDIIASVPNHEILEKILDKMLICYKELDAGYRYVGFKTGQVDMDLKRLHGLMRRDLTINSTGPGMLHEVLLKYWEKEGGNNFDKAHDFVSMSRTVFGLEFTGASDQTWLKPQKIKSYDDNELFCIRSVSFNHSFPKTPQQNASIHQRMD